MRRISLLLLMIVMLWTLAACGQSLPSAEEIVSRMEAARAATVDAHATVAFDFSAPERSGRIVVEGWTQQTGSTGPDGQPIMRVRAEVREASEPEMAGSIMVNDGTTFWLYNPTRNTVITGTRDELPTAMADSSNPSTAMLADLIGEGLDALDLTVAGSEQVAGKPTWKVEFTPKAETNSSLRLDSVVRGAMWVDSELALPLKLTIDASDFGQGSVEVQNLAVNSGLAAELFSFTPPPGAEVLQAADLAAEYALPRPADLDQARSAISFTLREPGYLPAGVSLVDLRVAGDTTVIMNYSGAETTLSLVQSSEEVGGDREAPPDSQEQAVTVAGLPATLITSATGESSLLRWQQDGVYYVIAGTLSGTESVQVAESLR